MYWAQRRILDALLYTLSYHGELPLLAGDDDLLNYLCGRGLAVVCGASTLDLEAEGTGNPTTAVPRWDDSGGG